MKAYHQFKKQQGIARLRLKLGLTQEAFAKELGISRSMLSKAENRIRSLPTNALLKLAGLEIKYAEISNRQSNDTNEEGGAGLTPVTISESEMATVNAESKIEKWEKELEKMADSYEKLKKTLQEVDNVIAHNSFLERFLPGSIESQRYKLIKKIHKCDPTTQQLLRKKIELLKSGRLTRTR